VRKPWWERWGNGLRESDISISRGWEENPALKYDVMGGWVRSKNGGAWGGEAQVWVYEAAGITYRMT